MKAAAAFLAIALSACGWSKSSLALVTGSPLVSINPTSVSFGTMTQGSFSILPIQLSVTSGPNSSGTTLSLATFDYPFQISYGNCPTNFSFTGSCSLQVTFNATSLGYNDAVSNLTFTPIANAGYDAGASVTRQLNLAAFVTPAAETIAEPGSLCALALSIAGAAVTRRKYQLLRRK